MAKRTAGGATGRYRTVLPGRRPPATHPRRAGAQAVGTLWSFAIYATFAVECSGLARRARKRGPPAPGEISAPGRQAPMPRSGLDYFFRRWCRIRFRSFLYLCLAIFLRRFFTTLPMTSPLSLKRAFEARAPAGRLLRPASPGKPESSLPLGWFRGRHPLTPLPPDLELFQPVLERPVTQPQ